MLVGSPKLDGGWNGKRPSYATTWRTINADRGQIGWASMCWKGGGESSQAKWRVPNQQEYKSESNVLTR